MHSLQVLRAYCNLKFIGLNCFIVILPIWNSLVGVRVIMRPTPPNYRNKSELLFLMSFQAAFWFLHSSFSWYQFSWSILSYPVGTQERNPWFYKLFFFFFNGYLWFDLAIASLLQLFSSDQDASWHSPGKLGRFCSWYDVDTHQCAKLLWGLLQHLSYFHSPATEIPLIRLPLRYRYIDIKIFIYIISN